MRGVLAETHVRDEDELVVALAQDAERGRDRSQRIERGHTALILGLREPEEKETANSRGARTLRDSADARSGPSRGPGQRRDRLGLADPRIDEDRKDEARRRESRLLKKAPFPRDPAPFSG